MEATSITLSRMLSAAELTLITIQRLNDIDNSSILSFVIV